ncbi:ABC transporter permease [Actinotalea caeni]|uniref:ABC transporter permease n=1 Tax=Actinotalea caeni TaxID=1348467 RepID=UPI0012E102C3|nr:ABC transporter permease [Actinotalea caeni]
MSATTAPARPDLVEQRPSPARRVWALARLELTLLVRNRTALFNALALAPLTVLAVSSFLLPDAAEGRGAVAATLLGTLLVFALVFAGYYNLCTTAVARREELMLKRLTTGELTRGEVLVAMSVPAFAVILAQVVLGAVAVAVLVEAPPLRNPVLVVLALVLGFTALAGLGMATAIVTRTVESAQITTLLPLGALMLLSGSTFPLDLMPDAMCAVAERTPLAAVNQLMTLGLSGIAPDGDAVGLRESFAAGAQPALVLFAWTVLAAYLVQKRMSWEPRR